MCSCSGWLQMLLFSESRNIEANCRSITSSVTCVTCTGFADDNKKKITRYLPFEGSLVGTTMLFHID